MQQFCGPPGYGKPIIFGGLIKTLHQRINLMTAPKRDIPDTINSD